MCNIADSGRHPYNTVMSHTESLNIISVLFDSWRWDGLGCAGALPAVRTPNIDALAGKGTRFERAFCSCALCGPSRMSLSTGRYMHTHRARWNDVPMGAGEVVDAEYFNDLGYQTAMIGKTHFCPPDDHHGYQIYLCQDGRPRVDPRNIYPHYLRRMGYSEDDVANHDKPATRFSDEAKRLEENGEFWGYHYPVRIPAEHSESRFVTDLALDYLARSMREPFFLHLSYLRPHPGWGLSERYFRRFDPADAPDANRTQAELDHATDFFLHFRDERGARAFDNELYRRQVWTCYLGLMAELDDMIGTLMDSLKKSGLMDRTLIVLSSDHGCYLGDHWMHQTEGFYDCQVRVPLIVCHPEYRRAAGTVGRLVETVDILPTLLESAGSEAHAAIQGRSLMPLIRGEEPNGDVDEAHAEWDFRYYASRAAAGLGVAESQGAMIRSPRYKLNHYTGLPEELYDLRDDPGELRNLASSDEYKPVADELRMRLLQWRMSTDDPTPRLSSEFKLPGSIEV